MRHLVRQSIKGGRCVALNQNYKSTISNEVFIFISKELNIDGNICEVSDKYFEYTKNIEKIIENEYYSQFEDYRDINQEEKSNYINKEINKLTIHKKIQKLNLNDVMMDFDAFSLYPSAMWNEKSIYPE